MWANTSGGGFAFGSPDVLYTPVGGVPLPIPYTNTAQNSQGTPVISNVIIAGAPVHNMATQIPITDGKNPGIAGVASGTVAAQSISTSSSGTVYYGGQPATRLFDTTAQNGGNVSGFHIGPSQTLVLILS
jgi:hypothetical protein